MNELKAEHPMLVIFKENGSLRITTIILDKLNQNKCNWICEYTKKCLKNLNSCMIFVRSLNQNAPEGRSKA